MEWEIAKLTIVNCDFKEMAAFCYKVYNLLFMASILLWFIDFIIKDNVLQEDNVYSRENSKFFH